jgi:hypothetical protein
MHFRSAARALYRLWNWFSQNLDASMLSVAAWHYMPDDDDVTKQFDRVMELVK